MEATLSDAVEDVAEVLRPVRNRTWDYWLVLLVITPLVAIIPVSWIYISYTLLFRSIFHLSVGQTILCLVALSEVVFSIYHFFLVRSIAPPGRNHDSGELPEMQLAFHRVLQSGLSANATVPAVTEKWDFKQADSFEELHRDDPRAVDFRNSLRCWFHHAPWSCIRKTELRRWLYWAMFNAQLPADETELPHAHGTALAEVFELLRRRTGDEIQDGSDPTYTPLLLTLDPVNVWARPLVWYLFVKAANAVVWMHMTRKWQVQHGRYQGMEYIIRTPTRASGAKKGASTRPIVLMHGLGLGLFQYSSLLSHVFDALPHCPVLVPLQPHISQDLFHPSFLTPMDRHTTVDTLAGLLTELGWVQQEDDTAKPINLGMSHPTASPASSGVTMLSHSNGSFAHAWMLKSYPNMVYRSCFVDPVAFCLWEGDVASNFLYRHAKNGLELIMRYFVGTELGVANLMQRHFDWASNALWCEDIAHLKDPKRAMFCIGGKDAIINADRVKRYLTSHGVREGLRFCVDGHHGEALLNGSEEFAAIMTWLETE